MPALPRVTYLMVQRQNGELIWSAKNVPFTPDIVFYDKKGRYNIVFGKIHKQVISLVSYYAPNMGQVNFLETMLVTLIPQAMGRILIGGDSSEPLDQSLDRSNLHIPVLKHVPKQGF